MKINQGWGNFLIFQQLSDIRQEKGPFGGLPQLVLFHSYWHVAIFYQSSSTMLPLSFYVLLCFFHDRISENIIVLNCGGWGDLWNGKTKDLARRYSSRSRLYFLSKQRFEKIHFLLPTWWFAWCFEAWGVFWSFRAFHLVDFSNYK